MRWIRPDLQAASVHDVDYEGLRRRGVKAILFDLENTLCLWRQWHLAAATWALLESLGERGLVIGVLTNAAVPPQHPLVGQFGRRGFAFFGSARKPLRSGFRMALEFLDLPPQCVAVVGDQLFTDVLGGRRAGLVTVLVDPMGREESSLTRCNRLLERVAGRRPVAPQSRAGRRGGR